MTDAMNRCPRCHIELRSHTPLDGIAEPSPEGACTMCGHCGGLIEWDASMRMVPMSDADAPEQLLQLRKGFLAARHAQENPSPREAMTVTEAFACEMDRGLSVLANTVPAECHICHETKELRVGACFDCQQFVRTNLIEAWELANPDNRWPYAYRGEPFDGISEEIAAEAKAMVERLTRKPEDPR